jgi:hypothetical protein
MKNAVFREVMACSACKNRHFGATYPLHYQGEKNQRAKNNAILLQLLVTANVPSSPILFILIMEAAFSSETSVLAMATQRHIPGGGILHGILVLDDQ